MPFEKGNTLSRVKRRPGGGRKKSPNTLIKEAKDEDAQNIPAYFKKLSELALHGDREALFNLLDRHLGKPKAIIEIPGANKLPAMLVRSLFEELGEYRREQYAIEQGKEQGENEANQVAH